MAGEEIVLGRIGHYHTPTGEGERGICRTALVTDVSESRGYVDLAAFEHEGDVLGARSGVLVSEPREFATFHLGRDCPWGR